MASDTPKADMEEGSDDDEEPPATFVIASQVDQQQMSKVRLSFELSKIHVLKARPCYNFRQARINEPSLRRFSLGATSTAERKTT